MKTNLTISTDVEVKAELIRRNIKYSKLITDFLANYLEIPLDEDSDVSEDLKVMESKIADLKKKQENYIKKASEKKKKEVIIYG